jgi:methyl-accepting chemotaxis protein
MPKFALSHRLSVLGRLTIRARILTLAALAAFGVSAMAGTYFFSNNQLSKAIHKLDAYGVLTEQAALLDIHALQLRRREKDFLLRKDVKYLDKYLADMNKSRDALDAITGMAVAGDMAAETEQLGVARTRRSSARSSRRTRNLASPRRKAFKASCARPSTTSRRS